MPTDAGSFRDVTVDGVPGVLIESRPQSRGSARTRYTLLWEKHDVVYSLSGWDDAAERNRDRKFAQVISASNHMQNRAALASGQGRLSIEVAKGLRVALF